MLITAYNQSHKRLQFSMTFFPTAQIYTAQWMRYGYVSPLICALANCCLAFMMAILFPETLLAAVSNGDTKLLRGDHGSETGQVEQNSCLRRVLKLSSKCWKMVNIIQCVDSAVKCVLFFVYNLCLLGEVKVLTHFELYYLVKNLIAIQCVCFLCIIFTSWQR